MAWNLLTSRGTVRFPRNNLPRGVTQSFGCLGSYLGGLLAAIGNLHAWISSCRGYAGGLPVTSAYIARYRMEQLGAHWTKFREVLYLRIF